LFGANSALDAHGVASVWRAGEDDRPLRYVAATRIRRSCDALGAHHDPETASGRHSVAKASEPHLREVIEGGRGICSLVRRRRDHEVAASRDFHRGGITLIERVAHRAHRDQSALRRVAPFGRALGRTDRRNQQEC
jgi:triphosphoribosyl-dephospho-CoA synthetase